MIDDNTKIRFIISNFEELESQLEDCLRFIPFISVNKGVVSPKFIPLIIESSAVRLIQYVVYDKSFYASYGMVAVEYDVKSIGLFDLIITFSFPLNLTFQRS